MAGTKQLVRVICVKGHTSFYPLPIPRLGSLQWCEKCDDFSEVKDVPDVWQARCTVRKTCFAQLRLTEEKITKVATTHAKSRRHRVQILNDNAVVKEWSVDEECWIRRTSIDEARAMKREADGK